MARRDLAVMSGRQGWQIGCSQPASGVQDVYGAVYAARQQKRSQQQALLAHGQTEQNSNWFKEKPASKSARLDIVTHHQQGATPCFCILSYCVIVLRRIDVPECVHCSRSET